jgi:hypothetical protein
MLTSIIVETKHSSTLCYTLCVHRNMLRICRREGSKSPDLWATVLSYLVNKASASSSSSSNNNSCSNNSSSSSTRDDQSQWDDIQVCINDTIYYSVYSVYVNLCMCT